ncbi:thioredoxin family protein [Pedobacter psychrodurus]|uniref:thioredoxin family protein n=1 Tax=Pedobacter psychrodurus TaxID=2530456 RepID=UPI00292E0E44|nr:thioredoxin family protein [Pedobacter psychrodurus]
MKTLLFLISVFLYFLFAGYAVCYSQGKAQSSDKKIKLYSFYFDGCGACKYMDKQVLSDEKVKSYLASNFKTEHVNGLVSPGSLLSKQYNIAVYPSFIFTDSLGTAFYRLEGASENPTEFMEELMVAKKRSLKKQAAVADFSKTYQLKKYDQLFVSGYIETLKAMGGQQKTIDSVFGNWFTNSDKTAILKDTTSLVFVLNNLSNLLTDQHRFFKANRRVFDQRLEGRQVEKHIASMIENSLENYLNILDEGNIEDIRNYLTQMNSVGDKDRRKIINNIEVTFYMLRKDYSKAVTLMEGGLVFDFEQILRCDDGQCREAIIQDIVLRINNNVIAYIKKDISPFGASVLKKHLAKWSNKLKSLNNNQANNMINHIDQAIKSRF